MNRPPLVPTLLNLLHDVRHWIEQRAQEDDRTLTATVVRAVRAEMDREKANEATG
jgi:hypothetical protein